MMKDFGQLKLAASSAIGPRKALQAFRQLKFELGAKAEIDSCTPHVLHGLQQGCIWLWIGAVVCHSLGEAQH